MWDIGSIGDRIVGPMTGAYHASKFAGRDHPRAAPRAVPRRHRGDPHRARHHRHRDLADLHDGRRQLFADLPPQAAQRYGGRIEATRQWARTAARNGVPPEAVARIIAETLITPRPRTRYLVGRDARIMSLIAYLPDRLRDRLILRQGLST